MYSRENNHEKILCITCNPLSDEPMQVVPVLEQLISAYYHHRKSSVLSVASVIAKLSKIQPKSTGNLSKSFFTGFAVEKKLQ